MSNGQNGDFDESDERRQTPNCIIQLFKILVRNSLCATTFHFGPNDESEMGSHQPISADVGSTNTTSSRKLYYAYVDV